MFIPVPQLATQFAGRVQFLKVDVDQAQDIARHFSVSAMPTFVVLRGIDKLDQLRGAETQALAAMVAKHAPAGGAAGSNAGSSAGSGSGGGYEGFVSVRLVGQRIFILARLMVIIVSGARCSHR